MIRPELADDPRFVQRFEAEAQLVARIEHPHVVPLYDFWRRPGGAFLVFRLLRGGSLADRETAGPLGVARGDPPGRGDRRGLDRGARPGGGAPRRETGQRAVRRDRQQLPRRLRHRVRSTTPTAPPRGTVRWIWGRRGRRCTPAPSRSGTASASPASDQYALGGGGVGGAVRAGAVRGLDAHRAGPGQVRGARPAARRRGGRRRRVGGGAGQSDRAAPVGPLPDRWPSSSPAFDHRGRRAGPGPHHRIRRPAPPRNGRSPRPWPRWR